MAIYEFICHDCEVIWEREAAMSKAPSRSRCPECKKLSNRHWGEVPVMFNGNDYYTNKRKNHKLVYEDKAKAKEVKENLLDAAKRQAEEKKSPYASYVMNQNCADHFGMRRKTKEELEGSERLAGELQKSVYNNHAGYRNLGKR